MFTLKQERPAPSHIMQLHFGRGHDMQQRALGLS